MHTPPHTAPLPQTAPPPPTSPALPPGPRPKTRAPFSKNQIGGLVLAAIVSMVLSVGAGFLSLPVIDAAFASSGSSGALDMLDVVGVLFGGLVVAAVVYVICAVVAPRFFCAPGQRSVATGLLLLVPVVVGSLGLFLLSLMV